MTQHFAAGSNPRRTARLGRWFVVLALCLLLVAGGGCQEGRSISERDSQSGNAADGGVRFTDLELVRMEVDDTWSVKKTGQRPSAGSPFSGPRTPRGDDRRSSGGSPVDPADTDSAQSSTAAPDTSVPPATQPPATQSNEPSELPDAVDLPERATGGVTSDPDRSPLQGSELFSLAGFDVEQLQIELLDCGADLPEGIRWELRELPQGGSASDGRRLEIWLAGDASLPQDPLEPEDGEPLDEDLEQLQQAPVAELRLDGQLEFRWVSQHSGPVLDQLRNTLLVLDQDGQQHSVRLRTPRQSSALTLSFDESVHYLALPDIALPKREAIEVKWLGENGLPSDIQFRLDPPSGQAVWDDVVTVNVSAWDGLYFEVGISERDQQPQVRVAHWYLRDRKRQPFSVEKVNRAIKQAQASLLSSGQKLAAAQAAIKQIPGEIKRVNGTTIPNGPGKAELLFERQKRVEALTRDLRNANNTAQRLATAIPRTQELLKALTELGQVGEKLHEQAEVQLSVEVKAEDGQSYPLAQWNLNTKQ